MATIRLNNSDLRSMIREAVSRLCEGQWYEYEPLCRLPYFVSVNFSDHALDREDDRTINENIIVQNLKTAVQDIIKDYEAHKLNEESYVKVIDRDSCVVTVCGIHPNGNKKRITQLVVVTAYVWDGKVNIDKGNNYYINEPSEQYIEAKTWNEENQDKVIPYMDWKRDKDIKAQRRKADTEYYWRNHPQEPSDEKRMNQLNQTYDRQAKRDRQDFIDGMLPGYLDAIRAYYRDMDNKRIELEPIEEIVHKAVRQALRENLRKRSSRR